MCMASGDSIPMPTLADYPTGTPRNRMLCPYDAMFGYACAGNCGLLHITNRNAGTGYPKGYVNMLHAFIRNNRSKVCWHPLEARSVCIDTNADRGDKADEDDDDAPDRKRSRKGTKKKSKRDRDRESG